MCIALACHDGLNFANLCIPVTKEKIISIMNSYQVVSFVHLRSITLLPTLRVDVLTQDQKQSPADFNFNKDCVHSLC